MKMMPPDVISHENQLQHLSQPSMYLSLWSMPLSVPGLISVTPSSLAYQNPAWLHCNLSLMRLLAAETTAATNHEDSPRQPATNMPPKTRPPFCVSFSSSSSFSSSYFSSFSTPSPPPSPSPSTWMHGWVDERMNW